MMFIWKSLVFWYVFYVNECENHMQLLVKFSCDSNEDINLQVIFSNLSPTSDVATASELPNYFARQNAIITAGLISGRCYCGQSLGDSIIRMMARPWQRKPVMTNHYISYAPAALLEGDDTLKIVWN